MPMEPPVRKTVGKAKAPSAKAGAPQAAAKFAPTAKSAVAKPGGDAAAKAKAKAPAVKVKLTKPVVEMIKWMNDSGELGKELRLGAVAVHLAVLSQDDALEVLEACMDFPTGRRDPIAFVKEAAKELATQAEEENTQLAQQQQMADEEMLTQSVVESDIADWTSQGVEQSLVLGKCPPLPGEVADMVDRMSFKGSLPATTEQNKLGAFLAFLGEGPAVEVLSDLGDEAAVASSQATGFIVKAAGPILEAERGSDFARRVSQRLRWMNFNLGFLSPLSITQAAFELAWIGETAALQVMKRMVKGASVGHLFADPTEWICRECRVLTGEEKEREEKERKEREEKEKEEQAVQERLREQEREKEIANDVEKAKKQDGEAQASDAKEREKEIQKEVVKEKETHGEEREKEIANEVGKEKKQDGEAQASDAKDSRMDVDSENAHIQESKKEDEGLCFDDDLEDVPIV